MAARKEGCHHGQRRCPIPTCRTENLGVGAVNAHFRIEGSLPPSSMRQRNRETPKASRNYPTWTKSPKKTRTLAVTAGARTITPAVRLIRGAMQNHVTCPKPSTRGRVGEIRIFPANSLHSPTSPPLATPIAHHPKAWATKHNCGTLQNQTHFQCPYYACRLCRFNRESPRQQRAREPHPRAPCADARLGGKLTKLRRPTRQEKLDPTMPCFRKNN